MNKEINPNHTEILSLISDLCQAVRYCRQDAVFYKEQGSESTML
jgi:hypothetical protein